VRSGSVPRKRLSPPTRTKTWEHLGFREDPVYPDAPFTPGSPDHPGKWCPGWL